MYGHKVDGPAGVAGSPVEGRPASPASRLTGWIRQLWSTLDMLFRDHGLVRAVYPNRFRITDRYTRSGQPLPSQLAKLQRQGIRTVLNLRGRRQTCGSYRNEVATCRALGLTLVDFPVSSRDLPTREALLKLRDLFRTMEYPVLAHCKAGADRVGLVSVLYMLDQEGKPLDEALQQLAWRYGHLRHGKTGILDFLFETYRTVAAAHPQSFWTWVETGYDRDALKAAYAVQPQSPLWSVLIDHILRRE